MPLHQPIMSGLSLTELYLHGLPLMLVKAWLILYFARIVTDQYEYSPASVRHRIWLIAFIGLAALPLLSLLLPSWNIITIDISANQMEPVHQSLFSTENYTSTLFSFSVFDWIIIGYLAVVLLRLMILSLHVAKVHALTLQATPATEQWYQIAARYYRGKLAIKTSGKLIAPVTWGTLQPVILLPSNCDQWSRSERELVILHEIGHIKRADWLSQLLSQVVSVLYWPLPSIKKALQNISLEAERACDDSVVKNGASPTDYASLLMRFAKGYTPRASVPMGATSDLTYRIRNILSPYTKRSSERKLCRWILVIGAVFVFPFASIQATGNYLTVDPLAGYRLTPIVTIKNIDNHFSVNSASCNCRETNNSSRARLTFQTANIIPVHLREKNIEGYVDLIFDIDSKGKTTNIRIIDSYPKGIFDDLSIKALAQWKYKPATKLGIAQIQKNELTRIHYRL